MRYHKVAGPHDRQSHPNQAQLRSAQRPSWRSAAIAACIPTGHIFLQRVSNTTEFASSWRYLWGRVLSVHLLCTSCYVAPSAKISRRVGVTLAQLCTNGEDKGCHDVDASTNTLLVSALVPEKATVGTYPQ